LYRLIRGNAVHIRKEMQDMGTNPYLRLYRTMLHSGHQYAKLVALCRDRMIPGLWLHPTVPRRRPVNPRYQVGEEWSIVPSDTTFECGPDRMVTNLLVEDLARARPASLRLLVHDGHVCVKFDCNILPQTDAPVSIFTGVLPTDRFMVQSEGCEWPLTLKARMVRRDVTAALTGFLQLSPAMRTVTPMQKEGSEPAHGWLRVDVRSDLIVQNLYVALPRIMMAALCSVKLIVCGRDILTISGDDARKMMAPRWQVRRWLEEASSTHPWITEVDTERLLVMPLYESRIQAIPMFVDITTEVPMEPEGLAVYAEVNISMAYVLEKKAWYNR
jgi:hypothetical protein